MDKLYSIKESTLKGLANSIRNINGESKSYTPTEMIEKVTTIMDSITYLLVDENGVEIPAVFVENETIFTAEAHDIRLGKIAANQNGVVEGTKDIPAYYTEEGTVKIKAGSAMTIPVFSDMCNYTKLQAIVCRHSGIIKTSVYSEKVVIDNSVYNVASETALSSVTVDPVVQAIEFGLSNDSELAMLIRYIIIKEEE